MQEKRVAWIDTAKVISMFIVVLGHTNVPATELTWIYSFHMPIFFFLSGAAYGMSQKRKRMKLLQYTLYRAQGLVWPYFTLTFLMLPMWHVSYKIYGESELSAADKIMGIFISNSSIESSPTNATWFLLTLFLVTIVYFLIERFLDYKIGKLTLWVGIIAAYGFLLSDAAGKFLALPWHIDVVPIGLLFFHMGVVFLTYSDKVIDSVGSKRLVYAIMLIVIGSLSAILNKKISMHMNVYNNGVLFLISSIFISLGIILVVWKIPGNFLIRYIAGCSIVIVAVHCPMLRFLEQYSEMTNQFVTSNPHLTALILFVASIIVASVIKLLFPFLIGERYFFMKKRK